MRRIMTLRVMPDARKEKPTRAWLTRMGFLSFSIW